MLMTKASVPTVPVLPLSSELFSNNVLSDLKRVVQSISGPINLFPGQWLTLIDPRMFIPAQGAGPNQRVGSTYNVKGFGGTIQAAFNNIIVPNLPVSIRVVLGLYQKCGSDLQWTGSPYVNSTNQISDLFQNQLGSNYLGKLSPAANIVYAFDKIITLTHYEPS